MIITLENNVLTFNKEIPSDGRILKELAKTLNEDDIEYTSTSVQGKVIKVSFIIRGDKRQILV